MLKARAREALCFFRCPRPKFQDTLTLLGGRVCGVGEPQRCFLKQDNGAGTRLRSNDCLLSSWATCTSSLPHPHELNWLMADTSCPSRLLRVTRHVGQQRNTRQGWVAEWVMEELCVSAGRRKEKREQVVGRGRAGGRQGKRMGRGRGVMTCGPCYALFIHDLVPSRKYIESAAGFLRLLTLPLSESPGQPLATHGFWKLFRKSSAFLLLLTGFCAH